MSTEVDQDAHKFVKALYAAMEGRFCRQAPFARSLFCPRSCPIRRPDVLRCRCRGHLPSLG